MIRTEAELNISGFVAPDVRENLESYSIPVRSEFQDYYTAPRYIQNFRKNCPLPHVMGGGVLVVSKEFKDFLEKAEPCRHEFFSVELFDANDSQTKVSSDFFTHHYYGGLLDILEIIDMRESEIDWVPSSPILPGLEAGPNRRDFFLDRSNGADSKLTFLSDKIRHRHLWVCSTPLYGGGVSDYVFESFMSSGLIEALGSNSGLRVRAQHYVK